MPKEPLENHYAWEFARENDKPPLSISLGTTTYMKHPRIFVEISGFMHPAITPKNYIGEESNNPALKEPVAYLKHVIQNAVDHSLQSRDMRQYHVEHEPFKGEGTNFIPGCDISRLCVDFSVPPGAAITTDTIKKNVAGMVEDITRAIDDAVPAVDRIIKKNAHLEPDMGSLDDVMASQRIYDEAQARARHELVKMKIMEEKGRG